MPLQVEPIGNCDVFYDAESCAIGLLVNMCKGASSHRAPSFHTIGGNWGGSVTTWMTREQWASVIPVIQKFLGEVDDKQEVVE